MWGAGSRRSWALLLAGAAFVAGWPEVLRFLGGFDVYYALGLYSLVIIATIGGLAGRGWWHRAFAERFARNAAVGLVVGAVMTAGTYAAYAIVFTLAPAISGHVAGLYRVAHPGHFAAALACTLVVIVAEEVLWRGPCLDVLAGRKRRVVTAISWGTYTAVQLATGSWVVALAALVCGAIWTAERGMTRSLVAPLASHLVWATVVIHLVPVTSVERAVSRAPSASSSSELPGR